MKNRTLLVILGCIFFLVTIGGFLNLNNLVTVIWYISPLGIFVWEDAIILGPFLLIGCIVLWKINRSSVTGLFFSTYVIVRSFIEAMYNLQGQFSPTTRAWEIAWRTLSIVQTVGVNEAYIFAQVCYTCMCILGILFFVKFLKQYIKEP